MKRRLSFIDLTAILAFVFAVWDTIIFMVNGSSPAFLLKFSITFLCANLLLNQLTNE